MSPELQVVAAWPVKLVLNHFQYLARSKSKGIAKIEQGVDRWPFFAFFQLDKIYSFQKRFLGHLPLAQIPRFPEFAQCAGNSCFEAGIILHPDRIAHYC